MGYEARVVAAAVLCMKDKGKIEDLSLKFRKFTVGSYQVQDILGRL